MAHYCGEPGCGRRTERPKCREHSRPGRAWAPTDGIVGSADDLRLAGMLRERELRAFVRPLPPTFVDAESGPSIGRSADVSPDDRREAAAALAEARDRIATAARRSAVMTDAERLARAMRTARALCAVYRPAGMLAPTLLDTAESAAADAVGDWYSAAARALGGDLSRLSALADLPDADLPPSIGYFVVAHVRRMLRNGRPADLSLETAREAEAETGAHPGIPAVPIMGGPDLAGPDDTLALVRDAAGAVVGTVLPSGETVGSADGTAEVVRVRDLCGADFQNSETGRAVLAAAHDYARRRRTARGTTRKATDRTGRPSSGRGRRDDGTRAAFARSLLAVPLSEYERARAFADRFGVSLAAWRVYKSRMLRA